MSVWDGKVVTFDYVNHEGYDEERRVVPTGIRFLESKYYPHDGSQWYIVGWCLDRQAERHFQVCRIRHFSKAFDQSLPWRTS
jgi:predicted DNA-binding transcriptional regulator YafY